MYEIIRTVMSRNFYVAIKPSFFPCDIEQILIYRDNDDIQNLAANSCFKLTVHPNCLQKVDFDALKRNVPDFIILLLLKDI